MSDDNIRDSILREGILGNKNNIVKSFGAGDEDDLEKAKRRTYQVGEISPNTGLQKQPDGSWAPPKKGSKSKKKDDESNIPETPKKGMKSVTYDSREDFNKDIKESDVFILTNYGLEKIRTHREKGNATSSGALSTNSVSYEYIGDSGLKRILQGGNLYKMDKDMAEFAKKIMRGYGEDSWHKRIPRASGGKDSPFRVFRMRQPLMAILPGGEFRVELETPRAHRHPDEYDHMTDSMKNALERIDEIEEAVFDVVEDAEKAGFKTEVNANDLREEIKEMRKKK